MRAQLLEQDRVAAQPGNGSADDLARLLTGASVSAMALSDQTLRGLHEHFFQILPVFAEMDDRDASGNQVREQIAQGSVIARKLEFQALPCAALTNAAFSNAVLTRSALLTAVVSSASTLTGMVLARLRSEGWRRRAVQRAGSALLAPSEHHDLHPAGRSPLEVQRFQRAGCDQHTCLDNADPGADLGDIRQDMGGKKMVFPMRAARG